MREVAAALGREYTLEILRELYARGPSSASELARDLGLHVATAMRKLAELEGLGLVERHVRAGSEVAEYGLRSPRIEIVLDLEAEARKAGRGARARAERVFLRETPRSDVVVEADDRAQVVRRLVFVKRLRWRTAADALNLSETEGRFLWHVPFGSQEPASVAAVCRRAGIAEPLQVARVLEFVEELRRRNVVEVEGGRWVG